MTTNDQQRIEFAERLGWKQLQRTTETLKSWPVDMARKNKIWYLDGYEKPAYWMPNPTSREDVHNAMMGMSEEEWHIFLSELTDANKLWGSGIQTTIYYTLKTPLPTLVECFMAATKGM